MSNENRRRDVLRALALVPRTARVDQRMSQGSLSEICDVDTT